MNIKNNRTTMMVVTIGALALAVACSETSLDDVGVVRAATASAGAPGNTERRTGGSGIKGGSLTNLCSNPMNAPACSSIKSFILDGMDFAVLHPSLTSGEIAAMAVVEVNEDDVENIYGVGYYVGNGNGNNASWEPVASLSNTQEAEIRALSLDYNNKSGFTVFAGCHDDADSDGVIDAGELKWEAYALCHGSTIVQEQTAP